MPAQSSSKYVLVHLLSVPLLIKCLKKRWEEKRGKRTCKWEHRCTQICIFIFRIKHLYFKYVCLYFTY